MSENEVGFQCPKCARCRWSYVGEDNESLHYKCNSCGHHRVVIKDEASIWKFIP